MFGRKSKKVAKKSIDDISIKTIPADFYAGNNPVIEFKEVKKVVELKPSQEKVTKKEKQAFHKKTVHGKNFRWHPANLFTNSKFLIIAAAVLFILFIAAASLYYWHQSKLSQKNQGTTPVQQIKTKPESVTTQNNSTSSDVSDINTTVASPTNTLATGKTGLQFPSILLGYGNDFDNDKLSDKEEEIFGTELAVVDSDGDNYPDGHEVYYLYNPAGKEPKRLIDSGKVKDFVNPTYNYKLYYPADWTFGSVDSNYKDVLFTALNGESIEVKLFDFTSQDFSQWFANSVTGEKYGLLEDFTGVFGEKGKMRNDKLVYYLTDKNYVYVLVYHGAQNMANYRAIIEMMARSFRSPTNDFVKQWASFTQTTTSSISITTSTITTSTIVTSTIITTTSPVSTATSSNDNKLAATSTATSTN